MNRQGPLLRAAIGCSALALVAGLAGCSNTSGGSTTDGTFTFGAVAAPPTMNPAFGDPAYNPLYQWAYESLVILEPDGSFSPGLATEFGYTDTDNKVYEITLRDGVKFSDGSVLDGEALKTYLEYERAQTSSAGLLLSSIDRIDVTSPMSVRLTLNRSDPGYDFYFAQAFGAGNIASPDAVNNPDSLNAGSAGAGQYMIDTANTVANDHYTFVPNPHYWNKDAVQFDKVVVQIVPNASSMIQGIRAGQIQAGQGDASSIRAAQDAGIEVVSAPQSLLGLNLMDRQGEVSAPLADPRVRTALNKAVNRDAIAAGLFGDAELATAQYALPGTSGHDDALDENSAYDPEQAKQLLADAGYPDGFEVTALSVPLSGLDKVVEAVAGDLSKVGVRVNVVTKPLANDYFVAMTSREFPTAAIGYGLHDANSLYTGFVGAQGPFNPFGSDDAELTALYARYFSTPEADAGDLEKQINARLVELGWTIPVLAAPLAFYVADGYTGLEATTRNAAVPNFTDLRPSS